MIITICGQAGSGKSTVGRLLAKKLRLRYYSIGSLRGRMAKERGMDINELNELGESEDLTDKEVDSWQSELGKKEDDFVIVGRTSFHFIPKSFKVRLTVDPKVGAERVFSDLANRTDESYSSLEEAKEALSRRDSSDRKRYVKWYGLDIEDSRFDLVIDTTKIPAEEVVKRIVSALKKIGKK